MRKKGKFLFVLALLLCFIPGMFLLGCDEEAPPPGDAPMNEPGTEAPIIED